MLGASGLDLKNGECLSFRIIGSVLPLSELCQQIQPPSIGGEEGKVSRTLEREDSVCVLARECGDVCSVSDTSTLPSPPPHFTHSHLPHLFLSLCSHTCKFTDFARSVPKCPLRTAALKFKYGPFKDILGSGSINATTSLALVASFKVLFS